MLEEFIKSVIPNSHNGKTYTLFDKDGKLIMDLESLIKAYDEITQSNIKNAIANSNSNNS